MTKIYEIGMDNNSESFGNSMGSDFLENLNKKEENTERWTLKHSEIRFATIGGVEMIAPEMLEYTGVTSGLLEDTRKNMDMVVIIKGKAHLVGNSAWISIKNRVDIYGKGFDLLAAEERVRDLNNILSLNPEQELKIIKVDNKIRAIMSKEYAVIKQNEYFGQIMKASEERFDSYSFVEGRIDYQTSYCKIAFESLKEELSELYELEDSFIPGLIIESSDTGHSGNKIGAFWSNGKGHSFILGDEYIYMKHRGKVTIDKIVEKLPDIFIKYQDTLKAFAEMISIEVDKPMITLTNACKELKLTKVHTNLLKESLEASLSSRTTCTAYDICQEILYLPYLVDKEHKISAEEKVGKAVRLDFSKLV